jgi:hypothetical protein
MMLTFATGTTLTLVHSKWVSGWDAVCAPLGQNDILCRRCAQKGMDSSQMLVAYSHQAGLHHLQQNFFSVVTLYQKK